MRFGNHSKMEGSTWKLAVFALLVIGSIAEKKTGPFQDQLQTNAEEKRQESKACYDKIPFCLKAKRDNRLNCRLSWTKQVCMKSCKTCVNGGTVAVCEDKNRVCKPWRDRGVMSCRSPYAKQFCKKTCNICGDGGTVAVCEDKSRVCKPKRDWGVMSCRSPYAKQFCKKTCNICGRTG